VNIAGNINEGENKVNRVEKGKSKEARIKLS
jgi:hypothetical protein